MEIYINQKMTLLRQKKLSNLNPLLRNIGEYLLNTTRERFDKSISPDNVPWLKNSPFTLMIYALEKSRGKLLKKNGQGTKKALKLMANKKPLMWNGYLKGLLFYKLSQYSVEAGSALKYAKDHQYGVKGKIWHTILGDIKIDIPARPFIGINAQNQFHIHTLVNKYLKIDT